MSNLRASCWRSTIRTSRSLKHLSVETPKLAMLTSAENNPLHKLEMTKVTKAVLGRPQNSIPKRLNSISQAPNRPFSTAAIPLTKDRLYIYNEFPGFQKDARSGARTVDKRKKLFLNAQGKSAGKFKVWGVPFVRGGIISSQRPETSEGIKVNWTFKVQKKV